MTGDPIINLMNIITHAEPGAIEYFRRKAATARIGLRRARLAALQRLVTRTMQRENERAA